MFLLITKLRCYIEKKSLLNVKTLPNLTNIADADNFYITLMIN